MRYRLLRAFDAVLPPSVALALAGGGATVSAFVVATTLPSGGPFVPTWVIWPLFLGCFPVHFRTVRTLVLGRNDLKERLLDTPRTLLAAAAVTGACAFAFFAHGLLTSRGNPERHGSAYFIRNHTELTRVSRSEYRYAERLTERFFVSGALLFYLIGILVHVGREHRASTSAGIKAPAG
jgi:hypothetical protein